MKKWIYSFDEAPEIKATLNAKEELRILLGGKGANLTELSRIGIPLPPFFVITTESCQKFYNERQTLPEDIWSQELDALTKIEHASNKKFGDVSNPLLVSCRASAIFPLPGMMDTVLNIGINDEIVVGLAKLSNNERFAFDSYRRFVQMFGTVVLGISDEVFEESIYKISRKINAKSESDLSVNDLKNLIELFKNSVHNELGVNFPQEPLEQLRLCTEAVFKSWYGKRAVDYRRATKISDELGVAVNIMTMVYGNMGENSGIGVVFTRNPSTGEQKLYGDYAINTRYEELIAGIQITKPINKLSEQLPETYEQLIKTCQILETNFHDMQEIEFIIENRQLWIQSTRSGKRTAKGQLRIALDLLQEGLISEDEVISRITLESLETIFRPTLPPGVIIQPFCTGINASSGIAKGEAVFSSSDAFQKARNGTKVILFLPFMKPEDAFGMRSSAGIVTSEGAATSHAAVTARQFLLPAIVGCSSLLIDKEKAQATISPERMIREGDIVTIDANRGFVYHEDIDLITHKTIDDIDLTRLEQLIWKVNSNSYLQKGIGHLWALRDALQENAVMPYMKTSPKLSTIVLKNQTLGKINYLSFVQPHISEFQTITNSLSWVKNDDIEINLVVSGFLSVILNMLLNEVGIGNHHKIYRPLNDPMISFIGNAKRVGIKCNYEIPTKNNSFVQLIGLDIFNINHYLKYLVDWENIQFWLAQKVVDEEIQTFWRLDHNNSQGEGIIQGDSILAGYLIVHNGKLLQPDEINSLYNALREREIKWDWYKRNKTSWLELKSFIEQFYNGINNDNRLFNISKKIGLIKNNDVTTLGLSLINEQCAQERKNILFFWSDFYEKR